MKINVGIGFVTGRKQFQNVLKSYINNWLEHGLLSNYTITFHVFVAYDLKYRGTKPSDYKNIPPELAEVLGSINFLDNKTISAEINYLKTENILDQRKSKLLFGDGYGKKRNVVTYFAIKHKMDRLIFIDDDEYPIATMKNEKGNLIWMGQSIVGTHLKYIGKADITHGHHCGYISPIPFIRFNNVLSENDFKLFIEAISNDIISWEKIKHLLNEDKGVTYADPAIINESILSEVKEDNGMKFISGANLCFNLKNTTNLPPFFNPPGARGEDTFMSTALSKLKVLKVPCYSFHDGFSMYNYILHGVLPVSLEAIDVTSISVLKRFIAATIGWIRYKPLLVYITQRGEYEHKMLEIEGKLNSTIPKLCAYFKTDEFEKLHDEFVFYRKNVDRHFNDFEDTKSAWKQLMKEMN